jgi:hypothetical protein
MILNKKIINYLKPKLMRKLSFFLATSVSIALLLSSCGGPKKASAENGSTEITLPFQGKEYRTDKEFFRSVQSGKSPDMSTAKKIALNNAKAEIAGLINSKIKTVTDNYTNQHSTANAQDFENKFETMTREVVNQQLSDISIKDDKLFKEKDNTYTSWVCIEISKEAVLNGINNSVSKNQKLSIDYDKKKFEETYNAEMDKMEKDK